MGKNACEFLGKRWHASMKVTFMRVCNAFSCEFLLQNIYASMDSLIHASMGKEVQASLWFPLMRVWNFVNSMRVWNRSMRVSMQKIHASMTFGHASFTQINTCEYEIHYFMRVCSHLMRVSHRFCLASIVQKTCIMRVCITLRQGCHS